MPSLTCGMSSTRKEGEISSSLSKKYTHSVLQYRSPAFLAQQAPRRGSVSTVTTKGASSANERHIMSEPSVEPLSTSTTSISS